ncbi:MAG: Hsp20/alpha crystallin family protein [Acutalibacteraceae bacterium]|jgi:HSP20 family protein
MFELLPFASRNELYNPFHDFDNFFGSMNLAEFKTDIREDGDHYVLEADLPGFNKEDIKVDIGDGALTITAQRKKESEEKGKNGYVRRERSYGSFRRSFDLTGVDAEKISGSYKDGVLTLNLPKQSEQAPASRRLELE